MTRPFAFTLTATLALLSAPTALAAQAVVQALPGTTDADRLGDVMRRVASNPRDIDALLRAGELSIVVGDLSGAAALFARAEKVDPRNGRSKAGMASILVRSERPGEALRYFAQAESLGLDPRRFAGDRALAFDLIGQQDRAQRDYRVALRDAPDDETVRRYALSLGISGQQAFALQQLAPLLQKSDRGAWRARAFILAMTGDVPAAERIATTMMPAGMAQGLLPFFARLPALPASDRAFAVHFGEVHATPARIADARMAPPLPVLGPDPSAPVMLAAAKPAVVVAAAEQPSRKRDRNTRRDRDRVQTAQASRSRSASTTPAPTTPVAIAAAQPRPTPAPVAATPVSPTPAASPLVQVAAVPTPTTPAAAPLQMVQSLPQRATFPTPTPTTTPTRVPPVALAAATPAPVRATTGPGELPATTVTQMAAIPAPASTVTRASSVAIAPSSTTSPASSPAASVAGGPSATVSAPAAPAAAAVTAATPAPVASGTLAPVTPTVAPAAAVAMPPPASLRSGDDSVLARIVAGLSIPASELDVGPVVAAPTPGSAVMSDDGARVLAEAKAKADRDAAAKAVLAKKLAAEKAAADKKAADKKAVLDRKALAEKKAAAEKKAIADKEAAEEKRIARANPERIWVQVAGGATVGDLPKAWKAVKAKAPDVFGSRAGWTTPLRATNRVLAGPFKTDAEARSFVNQLAKSGVSAFSFTSDAGQAVTRLPAK